jgi:hypothetical protein
LPKDASCPSRWSPAEARDLVEADSPYRDAVRMALTIFIATQGGFGVECDE